MKKEVSNNPHLFNASLRNNINAPDKTSTQCCLSASRYKREYLEKREEYGNNFDKPNILQKETHGEGKLRLLSGKKFPRPSNIFTPTPPA